MELSAADWERIEALLPEALSLPRDQREPFLRRHCQGADHLRAELESLIAAGDNAEGFLAKPVAVIGEAEPEPALLAPGTRLGPWKIGEKIGRGGMGEVYAAVRADGQFSMDAAVKILKRGLDTDELLQRFGRERNILARLSHPNIARLLDAGATEDHRPYYVMERVAGRSITAFCREHCLGVREVLRLMRRVCEAVDAAHRALVVHRDLKPSNVLVTDAGEVKLLDFGIAKVMSADGENTRTLGQDTMLTPTYAAPEQLLGGIVSTATDVYALGVMLYLLLTGRLPHRREGMPLATVMANLRDETTQRPSRIVAHQPTGPIRARELAGDLDLIVLKALHGDPARRYLSAHDLGADLKRFLDREPVEARPDSFGYRLGRLLQRHPLASAAAGVAVLSLVVGFAAAMWQARIAREQAAAAQQALATANAVNEFLNKDLLAGANPRLGPTKDLTVRGLLDRAAESVDARFATEPAAAAQVHATLGQAYQGIGELELARPQYERAIELFAAAEGPLGMGGLDARMQLARVLTVMGHQKEGCDLTQALEQQFQTVLAADDERRFSLRVGNLRCQPPDRANRDAAIEEVSAVVRDLERLGMTASRPYATALRTLGGYQFDNEDYVAAEQSQAKVLAYYERTLPPAHDTTNIQRTIWIGTLALAGRLAEADVQMTKAKEDARAWRGDDSAATEYLAIFEAILRHEQGRFVDAEKAARHCLETRLGQQRGYTYRLSALLALGAALLEQNRHEEAIRNLAEAVDYNRKIGEATYEILLRSMWSDALLRLGRVAEAQQVLQALTPEHLAQARRDGDRRALYLRSEGLLALKLGRTEPGRAALRESLEIYEKRFGTQHWRTVRAREELARVPPA